MYIQCSKIIFRLLLVGVLFFLSGSIIAQSYYANILFERDHVIRKGVVGANFEKSRLLLVYANTKTNLESGNYIYEIDAVGRVLDSLWILEDSVFLFSSGIFYENDSVYVLAGGISDNPKDKLYPYIIWVDLKNKEYEIRKYDAEYRRAPRSYIRTRNRSIVGAGYSVKNGYSQFYLAKFSAEGDLLWEKEYGSPGWQDAHSVVELPDGGFAIGGWKRRGVEFKQDHYVVRTDSLGNPIWQKIFGNENNGIVKLSVLNNGNLIGSTLRYRNHISFDATIFEMNAINGSIVWEKTFEHEWNNRFSTPAIILHGDTMVVGGYRGVVNADSTRTWRHATLTKLDPRGNIIWDRMFYYEKDNNHYLEGRGLVQDDEGNFWAYGQMNPHGWLIKLDSMGCPYPDCDSITVSAGEVMTEEYFQFIAAPNPVADQLRVYYRFVKPLERPWIEIIDMNGKVRDRIPLNGNAPEGDVWIQCSHWPVGTYLLRLISGEQVIGIRKVVVLR